jgi:hypothetical protein
LVTGNYRALEWSEARQEYIKQDDLGILVEVEVKHYLGLPQVYSNNTAHRK